MAPGLNQLRHKLSRPAINIPTPASAPPHQHSFFSNQNERIKNLARKSLQSLKRVASFSTSAPAATPSSPTSPPLSPLSPPSHYHFFGETHPLTRRISYPVMLSQSSDINTKETTWERWGIRTSGESSTGTSSSSSTSISGAEDGEGFIFGRTAPIVTAVPNHYRQIQFQEGRERTEEEIERIVFRQLSPPGGRDDWGASGESLIEQFEGLEFGVVEVEDGNETEESHYMNSFPVDEDDRCRKQPPMMSRFSVSLSTLANEGDSSTSSSPGCSSRYSSSPISNSLTSTTHCFPSHPHSSESKFPKTHASVVEASYSSNPSPLLPSYTVSSPAPSYISSFPPLPPTPSSSSPRYFQTLQQQQQSLLLCPLPQTLAESPLLHPPSTTSPRSHEGREDEEPFHPNHHHHHLQHLTTASLAFSTSAPSPSPSCITSPPFDLDIYDEHDDDLDGGPASPSTTLTPVERTPTQTSSSSVVNTSPSPGLSTSWKSSPQSRSRSRSRSIPSRLLQTSLFPSFSAGFSARVGRSSSTSPSPSSPSPPPVPPKDFQLMENRVTEGAPTEAEPARFGSLDFPSSPSPGSGTSEQVVLGFPSVSSWGSSSQEIEDIAADEEIVDPFREHHASEEISSWEGEAGPRTITSTYSLSLSEAAQEVQQVVSFLQQQQQQEPSSSDPNLILNDLGMGSRLSLVPIGLRAVDDDFGGDNNDYTTLHSDEETTISSTTTTTSCCSSDDSNEQQHYHFSPSPSISSARSSRIWWGDTPWKGKGGDKSSGTRVAKELNRDTFAFGGPETMVGVDEGEEEEEEEEEDVTAATSVHPDLDLRVEGEDEDMTREGWKSLENSVRRSV
ncbi:hypothetical protein T439DRAFT_355743 [Meredithblackwellia eburnea MCA 4105]